MQMLLQENQSQSTGYHQLQTETYNSTAMEMDMSTTSTAGGMISELYLPPGFRFHPTDEELVVHYLSRKLSTRPYGHVSIIADVNLYKFDPWDLPQQATFGEKEWYFFSPRDKKYPNGARPNRAAASGYWKATGTDKPVYTGGGAHKIGIKKALVFYKGRAPRGVKTNWIMHEYRLAESDIKAVNGRKKGSLKLDDWVLCRIYKKKLKNQKPPPPTGKLDLKKPNHSFPLEEDVLASLPEIDTSRFPISRWGPFTGFMQEQHSESFPQNINPYNLLAAETCPGLRGQPFQYQQLENNQRGGQANPFLSPAQISVADSINLSLSSRDTGLQLPQGLNEKYDDDQSGLCMHNSVPSDQSSAFKQQQMNMSSFTAEDMQSKVSFFSRDEAVEDDAYKPSVSQFHPFFIDIPQFFQQAHNPPTML